MPPLGISPRQHPDRSSFDRVLAGLGLLLAAPVLVVSAIAIPLTRRGPAIFRQARVGQAGEPFDVLKLRTMRVASSPEHDAAPGAMCEQEIRPPPLPAGTSDGLYK